MINDQVVRNPQHPGNEFSILNVFSGHQRPDDFYKGILENVFS
jgi:hypothetical protein